MKNLPKDINHELSRQEKHLDRKNEEECHTDRMLNKISMKINKDKNDVLMNKVDIYRAKKEIREMMSNSVDPGLSSDPYLW